MDRRQRKTREAIFGAFSELVSKKNYGKITVGEIIEKADVGRATFYAHFETKDELLKEFCEELFCHVFDSEENNAQHRHIFQCEETTENAFLHLFRHLEQNDNHILNVLSSENNELFLSYFKSGLMKLTTRHLDLFAHRKSEILPDEFWKDHIASTFIETLRWWLLQKREQSPETICEYFFLSV